MLALGREAAKKEDESGGALFKLKFVSVGSAATAAVSSRRGRQLGFSHAKSSYSHRRSQDRLSSYFSQPDSGKRTS